MPVDSAETPSARPRVALVGYDEPFVMPAWVPVHFVEQGVDFTVRNCQTAGDAQQFAAGATVVLTSSGRRLLSAEVIRHLRTCRAIVRIGSGVDCIDLDAAAACHIPVINTPEALADAVAEHTIALLLAAIHQVPAYDQLVKQGQWHQRRLSASQRMHRRVLGLIGFGRIARQVVALLAGYQMRVLVYDPFVSPASIEAAGGQPLALEDVLREADFVSIHAALTPATYHLIGQSQLRMMKPTAILVNSARGGLVDQASLALALHEGWIAGAALDVTEPEPPAPDDPLLQLDNIVLTPHTGAFSEEVRDRMYLAGCDAAMAVLDGNLSGLSLANPSVQPWWHDPVEEGR